MARGRKPQVEKKEEEVPNTDTVTETVKEEEPIQEVENKDNTIKDKEGDEKETTAVGWGEPDEKPSTTESETVPTDSKPVESTGGWGAPEEPSTNDSKPVESTGGWGAPEASVENTTESTGGWGAPLPSNPAPPSSYQQTETDYPPREQEQSYQRNNNSSYSDRPPRRNDSYRSESRGRSFDRPPREGYQQRDGYQREQRSFDRYPSGGHQPSHREDSFREEEYPRKRYDNRQDSYSREDKRSRYDDRGRQQDDYNREDKRSRYDERPSYNNRPPQDEYYNRGRSEYPPSRDDRYNRPPQDDYERGRERGYDRNSNYESRGDNEKPYEPRVSRERKPFPSNVSPSKAIGIFGLSVHATENDLREFLSEELTNISDYKITIVHDRTTGLSKGYGFVYFQSLEDSISAKERLTGKSIKGKEIRVDFSISDALRPSYR